MGRTIMERRILIIKDANGRRYDYPWSGRVTPKRLEKHVISIGKSFMPSGVNFHVSQSLGYIPTPVYAEIFDCKTKKTLLTWKAPAFMVW